MSTSNLFYCPECGTVYVYSVTSECRRVYNDEWADDKHCNADYVYNEKTWVWEWVPRMLMSVDSV